MGGTLASKATYYSFQIHAGSSSGVRLRAAAEISLLRGEPFCCVPFGEAASADVCTSSPDVSGQLHSVQLSHSKHSSKCLPLTIRAFPRQFRPETVTFGNF